MPAKKKLCVFTALIGDYEDLNEQPIAKISDADFICFTNRLDISSSTWNINHIEPLFPHDLRRSQRSIKILMNKQLSLYDCSIYIDNSVILKKKPEVIIRWALGSKYDIALLWHSFRKNVAEEFLAVSQLCYDDQEVLLRHLIFYMENFPHLLVEKPRWGGIIIRNHGVEAIETAMLRWYSLINKYSLRDQLSMNYALQDPSLRINSLSIDNNNSKFHSWPHSNRKFLDRNSEQILTQAAAIKKIYNLTARFSSIEDRGKNSPETSDYRINKPLILLNGGNISDAGGELGFGTNQHPNNLPMSSIKGVLANATDLSSQGGIVFSTRDVGLDDQKIEERLRIRSNGVVNFSDVSKEKPPHAPGDFIFDGKEGNFYVSLDGKNWVKMLIDR